MALNTSIRGLQIRDAFFGDGIKRNAGDGDIAEVALKSSGGLKIDTAEIAVEPNDFAGNGLADDGSDNLKLDLNGLSDTAINVANDYIAFDDADDSESKKESVADFVDAIAGDALTTDADGLLDVEVDGTTIEISGDAIQVANDGISNDKLANMTQGTVKVGGASDAPTDLDAKTDGYILIGDGTDVNSVEVTGDITITNAGVTTIGSEKVDVGMININNAEVDGYVLTWNDSGYMEWTSKTASDAVADSDIKVENESANCNGVTVAFNISSSPIANSVQVYLNGLLQEDGSGKDYTISGTTITFATAPETGDILIIHYIAT